MDLNTITAVERPSGRDTLPAFDQGDAWLAGGTWLFSEPQSHLTRLVDLSGLGWTALEITPDGLSIGATCTVGALDSFEPPPAWIAGPLISQCCNAFLASFKIQSLATVGGNLCMALPAGPMISLGVALDGRCLIWTPDGDERSLSVVGLITGAQATALRPGELLRRIDLPTEALRRRTAFRRISLTPLGRSGALLIGTLADDGRFALTVTASTRRPVQIRCPAVPEAAALQGHLDTHIPPELYFDDMHGRPDWRRHMTCIFAEEIRAELAERAV